MAEEEDFAMNLQCNYVHILSDFSISIHQKLSELDSRLLKINNSIVSYWETEFRFYVHTSEV